MFQLDKIRVLLCSPRGESGGIASWTEHVLGYYHKTGDKKIEMDWAYCPPGKEVLANTPLLKRLLIGVLYYSKLLWLIRRTLRNKHYDVVHFISSASISLIKDIVCIRIAHHYKTKIIIHFRFGRIPELFESGGWEKRLIEKVIKKADKVIVIDKRSYDVLISNGFNNICLLPNPVSEKIVKAVKLSNVERKKNEILFAGHLVKSKGVFELIEACRDIPDIHLTMMGKGTDDAISEIKKAAGDSNENWLSITGARPLEEVTENMLSCSVFVLPTYTEGFPNVIIESMACACPIVTTDVGAIPEMLDIDNEGIYGICVKPRQVRELRKAILWVLNNEKLAINMGKRARERVNELYSMPKVWEQMTQIWIELAVQNN